MPNIVKQSPVRPPSRNGNAGDKTSILSQAVDVSSLREDYIKMVIYGQNRVGKTTLACDFPKPLLLISFEPNRTGGAQSVKKVQGVKYLRITSVAQAMGLAEEIRDNTDYRTHVLDTATSLQDVVLQDILNLDAMPEQLDWGTVTTDQYRQRAEKTKELLRKFLNLPAHTVVCAKERDHNPNRGWEDYAAKKVAHTALQTESFVAADLGGATAGWLHDACDYIGRLYLDKETVTRDVETVVLGKKKTRTVTEETGRVVRRLRTLYHPNYAAGFRSCDPDKVPEFIEFPNGELGGRAYARIKAVIDGRAP